MDGKIALETLKSFKTLLPPTEFGEFLKGEESAVLRSYPETEEFIKAETEGAHKEPDGDEGKEGKKKVEGEPDGDEPEELKKAVGAVELAKANLATAEAELAKVKPAPVVAPVTPEMFKGLQDEIGVKFGEVTKLLTKAINPPEGFTELKKAVDQISEVVSRIAGQPLGTKAIKGQPNFFEKALGEGAQEDESGKTVLSVTAHKEQVTKAMVDVLEKSTDLEPELKKAYEDSIMRYNAGGGTIEKAVGIDLFENRNIRLVK
jgi:hypothetical protein